VRFAALLLVVAAAGAASAQAPDFDQDPFAEPAPDPFSEADDAQFELAANASGADGGAGDDGAAQDTAADAPPASDGAPRDAAKPAQAKTPGVEAGVLVGAMLLLALAVRRR
jgi:hypothetical protein